MIEPRKPPTALTLSILGVVVVVSVVTPYAVLRRNLVDLRGELATLRVENLTRELTVMDAGVDAGLGDVGSRLAAAVGAVTEVKALLDDLQSVRALAVSLVDDIDRLLDHRSPDTVNFDGVDTRY